MARSWFLPVMLAAHMLLLSAALTGQVPTRLEGTGKYDQLLADLQRMIDKHPLRWSRKHQLVKLSFPHNCWRPTLVARQGRHTWVDGVSPLTGL